MDALVLGHLVSPLIVLLVPVLGVDDVAVDLCLLDRIPVLVGDLNVDVGALGVRLNGTGEAYQDRGYHKDRVGREFRYASPFLMVRGDSTIHHRKVPCSSIVTPEVWYRTYPRAGLITYSLPFGRRLVRRQVRLKSSALP